MVGNFLCLWLGISIIKSQTIWNRNPRYSWWKKSPVDVGSLSHYLHGFLYPRWLAGFLNHQQYLMSLSFGNPASSLQQPQNWDVNPVATWLLPCWVGTPPRVSVGKKVPQNYLGSAWDAVLDPRQADVRMTGMGRSLSHQMNTTHMFLEWKFLGQTVCECEKFRASRILDCRWGIFSTPNRTVAGKIF